MSVLRDGARTNRSGGRGRGRGRRPGHRRRRWPWRDSPWRRPPRAEGADAAPAAPRSAEESVQPVPCVFCVGTRLPSSQITSPPWRRRSGLSSPSRCPPFKSTFLSPRPWRRAATAGICLRLSAGASPSSAAASGRLGVISVASGRIFSLSAVTAASGRRRSPPLAIMTGSTTTARGFQRWSASATASMTSGMPSMPIFTASTARSEKTESICWRTKSAGIGKMPWTPWVFWAVRAVMAEQP